ncbi:class I SAM-dependent methyltransferase [Candidatus Pelagibacter sp.]|nr:class I SAM-dependent methyltransferase [Candidatus Pelagibacter sp.]
MICKITNKSINSFMNFGKMPISNNFLKKESFKDEFFYDMNVGFSEEVSLLQLGDHPKPEQMFNKNYPFFTSSSKFMVEHFKEYAAWVMKNYLKEKSKVIEIGSNDGTMLKNFADSGFDVLGIEPSSNCAKIANENSVKTVNKFFNLDLIDSLGDHIDNTEAIIAANCICHIPDLTEVFIVVNKLLSNSGVFIFEEPYLGSMYKKVSYDQIYDEHIFIFSVSAINKIAKLFDLDLVDVIEQPTHGGSMRYVLSRKNKKPISKNVNYFLEKEKLNGHDTIEGCKIFKKNCEISKINLQNKINEIKNKNKKIVGYAATSKSTTILNYCDIGIESINCIYDTTKEKIGKFTPGSHIPIRDMNEFKNDKKDYVYLFAWNHQKEIFKKEISFLEGGGKWISHVKL